MPDETAAAVRRADRVGEHRLEARPGRAERQPARAQHLEHELLVALVDPRRAEVDPVRRDAHAARELRHVVEPLRPPLALAADGVEVRRLQLQRDSADAELVVVDRAQRRHLGGGAAHEHLVGQVEVGADERLLDHAVAEVLGDLLDRVARDARQDPVSRPGV